MLEEQRADRLDAIWKEIKGLVDLGTFSLEPLPAGQRALDSRIVLKVKYRADGLPRTVNGTGHTGPSEFCATSI